jgi:hypothetical protein
VKTLLQAPLTLSQKLLWLLFCLAFFAALCYAFRQVEQTRLEGELGEVLHEADQRWPGWQLAQLEAARETIPDQDNSAFIVQRTARYLSQERLTPPVNVPLYGREFLTEPLTPLEDLTLTAHLDQFVLALAEAYDLADRPRGRHPLTIARQPWLTSVEHLVQVMYVRILLLLEVVRRCQRQDFAGAALACRATLNAARSLGDEPLRLSQCERRESAVQACRGLHYLLNHGEIDAGTLAVFQRQIEDEVKHPAFLIALRGERALLHAEIEAMEAGEVSWQALLDPHRTSQSLFWEWTPTTDDIRRQHLALFPLLDQLIELGEAPPHQRLDLRRKMRTDLQSPAIHLLAPLLRHLGETQGRFTRLDAWLNCYAVAIAVERYRLLHGAWPNSLDALRPALLSQVPLDAADGAPLRYDRRGDHVAIYSRYRDFNRNVFQPEQPNQSQNGIGVRLWNPAQRGQPLAVSARKE